MSFSAVLEAGFEDDLQTEALEVIKEERKQYQTVYDAITEYCSKHELIISNKYILTSNEDEPVNVHRRVYKIYSSNPFRHANALTNLIYQKNIKDPNAKYTKLNTVQEREEFSIDYNMRQIVQIFKVQKHRGTEPREIIKPVKMGKLLYMPSEIELIDIYHTLYDPSQYSDWDDAIKYEKILFEQVVERKSKGVLGGLSCKDKKRHVMEAMKIEIVKDWLKDQDKLMLIGPWAYDWIRFGDKLCVNKEKVQLIGDVQPEELLLWLQKFANEYTKFEVTMREQKLQDI